MKFRATACGNRRAVHGICDSPRWLDGQCIKLAIPYPESTRAGARGSARRRLADVLGTSLLRNAMYRRIECGAPWGIDVPQHDRALFYVLVRGNARVEIEGEPVCELSAGDTLFIPTAQPTSFAIRSIPTA